MIGLGGATLTGRERGFPAYASTAGQPPPGPFSPGIGLYNAKGSNMRKTHAGLVRAMNGGKMQIACFGDSVGTGYNGAVAVDDNSYVQRLGRGLAAMLNVPRAGGFHAAISALSISTDRWTLNSGTVNGTNFAGMLQINAGGSVTFTPQMNSTNFEFMCTDNSVNNFTYQVDGGAAVPVPTGGSATYKKVTTGVLASGLHTITFNAVGGLLFLVGVRPIAAAGIEIHNLSFGGGRAASGPPAVNWTDTSPNQLYSNHKLGWDAFGVVPDLCIYELGGNDMFQGDTPANAIAGLATMRAWYPNSDALLLGFNAINGTNMANFDDYCARKYALADTLDCPFLDLRFKMGDYAEALANGLLGSDNLHLSNGMNKETGRLLATGIIQAAGGLTDLVALAP